MSRPPDAERSRPSIPLLLTAVAAIAAVIAMILAGPGRPFVTGGAAPGSVAPAANAGLELTIPKIGVESSLIGLGLNPDHSLAVPSLDTPMQASWYTGGPMPGAVGPAIVLGHIDARNQPGVFWRLRELVPGDQATVRRPDGSVATFTVTSKEEVPKTRFPTEQVYHNTPGPELRLITCGGSFDQAKRSYRDNIIIFATLTRLTPPVAP